jgi:hypothetical protein
MVYYKVKNTYYLPSRGFPKINYTNRFLIYCDRQKNMYFH